MGFTRHALTTLQQLVALGLLLLPVACGGRAQVLPGGQGLGTDSDGSTGSGSSTDLEKVPPFEFDCSAAGSQQFDPQNMKAYSLPTKVADQVEQTFSLMSPAAKYAQMTGQVTGLKNYRDIQRNPDVEVPDVGTIRGFRYRDGGKGVNLEPGQDNRPDNTENYATAFPATSVRGASWDLDLERRVGSAIGDETAASLNNVLLAPCMNVVRHPYWGRTQETYGEDSYHIGRMATAMAVGIQEYVVGCAKHFVANNIENKRSSQNAVMDEQTLREIFGRHFEMVVQDAGIGCVMAAYNSVNGEKSTQNRHLLRDILKAPVEQGGMGFEGFVMSDWWAMPGDQAIPDPSTAQAQTTEAVLSGMDVEVPWQLNYSDATLKNADQNLIDEAARRVLTQKYRFKTALTDDAWSLKKPTTTLAEDSIVPYEAHEALAEEAARKSVVLLVNGAGSSDPVLPLEKTGNIAVVGPGQRFELISSSLPNSCVLDGDLPQDTVPHRECTFHFATDPALGDRGTSRVNGHPARTIGPHAGIETVAGVGATVTSGHTAEDAALADVIVVVVGYTPGDEGEEYPIAMGGDRASLDLPPGHNELVMSVLDLDKPTVVIVESGSIVNLPWLQHANQKQATIWAGYPGQRGGLALGKLIFGEANFSGKMPLAWPKESDLQPFKDEELVTNMGYFFGYREWDRRKYVEGDSVNLVFPFGHGLSYSTFVYSNLTLPCQSVGEEAIFEVTVDITNTSSIDGDEVALLFVKPPPKPSAFRGERPHKELKSFARVAVPAGRTVTARLPLRMRDLRRWEGGADGRWVMDSGDYTILVGKNAEDAETKANVGVVRVEAQ